MQSTVDSNSSFPLREVARHLDQAAAEKGIDALLARAQKNTEQAEQDAAVEAAQRAAEKATAMAQGAIGETVQNVAEAPVATQAAEKTSAAAHVPKEDYKNSLGSFSHEISLDPIDAAGEIFKNGLDIINERKGSTLTNDLTETDFGLAA